MGGVGQSDDLTWTHLGLECDINKLVLHMCVIWQVSGALLYDPYVQHYVLRSFSVILLRKSF